MPTLYYDNVWLAMLKKNQKFCNTGLVNQQVVVEPLNYDLQKDADYKWVTEKIAKIK